MSRRRICVKGFYGTFVESGRQSVYGFIGWIFISGRTKSLLWILKTSSKFRQKKRAKKQKLHKSNTNIQKTMHLCVIVLHKCIVLVEATGFEPTTSWSRTMRATNCATPRLLFSFSIIHQFFAFCQPKKPRFLKYFYFFLFFIFLCKTAWNKFSLLL